MFPQMRAEGCEALELTRLLVNEGARDGYGEYRTHVALMDDVMATFNYNYGALLRLHERIKDALDPNGFVDRSSTGRLSRLPSEQRSVAACGDRLRSSDARGLRAAKLGVPKYPGRYVAPVGAQAGAQDLAANVYELDPGAVGSPLHVHHANEELLLVLAGTLTLRGPDGTQLLPAARWSRSLGARQVPIAWSTAPTRPFVTSCSPRPTAPTSSSTPTQPRRLSSSPSSVWRIHTARTLTNRLSSPKRCGRQPTETRDPAKSAATALTSRAPRNARSSRGSASRRTGSTSITASPAATGLAPGRTAHFRTAPR